MAYAPFDLSGHVALVTGGNGGIGLGMAEGLAQAGADIAIWGTNEAKNADAVARLEVYGGHVVAFPCDVGDEHEVDAAFAATVEALGKVDSCFANAGIGGMPTRFTELDAEEWGRVLRVDLDGVFFTFRAAARHLVERRAPGSLVVTGSIASVEGPARQVPYAVAKSGVGGLVRALAVELAPRGIRVNMVVPGWTETAMTEPQFGWDKFRDAVLPRIPAGRWGAPEDFAGVAVYLAGAASAYHTGDSIRIDGAYTLF